MDQGTSFSVILLNGSRLTGTFPSDEAWVRRQKARKLIQRPAGRGETATDVVGGDEADLELFRKIVNDESFSDADEASLAVEKLSFAQVTGVQPAGECFEIALDTFLGARTYSLKRPSAAQVKRYRGFAYAVDLPHGRTEIRINLSLPAEIFDQLCPAAAADTSILYKMAAVSAVMGDIQRLTEPSERP